MSDEQKPRRYRVSVDGGITWSEWRDDEPPAGFTVTETFVDLVYVEPPCQT